MANAVARTCPLLRQRIHHPSKAASLLRAQPAQAVGAIGSALDFYHDEFIPHGVVDDQVNLDALDANVAREDAKASGERASLQPPALRVRRLRGSHSLRGGCSTGEGPQDRLERLERQPFNLTHAGLFANETDGSIARGNEGNLTAL